jgi:CheY-like chemotaxis protein
MMRRPPRGEQRIREEHAAPSAGSPEIDDLARNVGHAINNPLGALMLTLELALETLGDRQDPSVESLRAQAVEARGLLTEALEAAQSIRLIVAELKAKARPSTTKELAPRQRSSPPPPDPQPASPKGVDPRARVLVVDDDELVSRALARTLREFDVVVALDGRSALASIERGEQFDVIVCDLMMPNMTGMDLYDAIRRVAPGQIERMVFVSGGAVTTRAREFAATVPNVFMEKPLDVKRLRDIVRSRKS